jgi:hypothetical protein
MRRESTAMQLDQKSLMLRAIDLALTFDRPSLLAAHRAFLAKYPQESRERLALRLVSGSAWRAVASGAVTGLPSNPWVAVPAALADTAAMIRIEAYVAARVALLFDEHYFDGEELRYELMLPVMGGYVASAPVGEPADHGKASVTRRILRNVLSKESLRQLKGMMLKYFGAKVTQRALVTKTLPIVGGALSGAWNYVELRMVGQRSYAYFAANAK